MSSPDLTAANIFEEETPWYRSPLAWSAAAVVVLALGVFLIDRLLDSARDAKTADFLSTYAMAVTPADKLKVVRQHLDLPDAAVELLTLGSNFAAANDAASAQEAFSLVVDHFPNNPLVDAARIGEAESLMAQGKPDLAIPLLQTVTSSGSEGYRPAAFLSLARVREEKKDFGGARQALQELIAKYPSSAFAPDAQRELAGLPAA